MISLAHNATPVFGAVESYESGYSTALDSHLTRDIAADSSSGLRGALEVLLGALRGSTIMVVSASSPQRLPTTVEERLSEIAELNDEWSEGASRISGVAIATARALLMEPSTPHPDIFPRLDGGVRLEWLHGRRDVSIDVDAAGQFYLHYLDLDSPDNYGEAYEFTLERAIARLRRFLVS